MCVTARLWSVCWGAAVIKRVVSIARPFLTPRMLGCMLGADQREAMEPSTDWAAFYHWDSLVLLAAARLETGCGVDGAPLSRQERLQWEAKLQLAESARRKHM